MKKATLIWVGLIVLGSLLLLSCSRGPDDFSVVRERAAQRNLVVQVPEVKNFTEAKQIAKKVQLTDDPNTIMWITTLSDMGGVIYYGPVVGKVTSSSKRLEPKARIDDYNNQYGNQERMQADATYGESDPYIYWFDPNGVYHQWNGLYFLTSVPYKVQPGIINYRNIDTEAMAKQLLAEQALREGKKIDLDLNVKN